MHSLKFKSSSFGWKSLLDQNPTSTTGSKTHLITLPKILHLAAFLYNFPNKLMPTNEPRRRLQMTAIKVQIATAQRRRCDFEHAVCRLLDLGVGSIFNGHLVRALVDDRSH